MKTRILFPVMLVALLCIPTPGSATIIPVGEPILGNSWTQQFAAGTISVSDSWEVDILTPGITFEAVDVDFPYLSSISMPTRQKATFSGPDFGDLSDPLNPYVNFWLTFSSEPETSFVMNAYQFYQGGTLPWDDSAQLTWTGSDHGTYSLFPNLPSSLCLSFP